MNTLRKLVLSLSALCLTWPAWADNKAVLMDELAGYLEFVDYGGGTIFA